MTIFYNYIILNIYLIDVVFALVVQI
jgi:hypothetical protein